jgi:hypothetical protein
LVVGEWVWLRRRVGLGYVVGGGGCRRVGVGYVVGGGVVGEWVGGMWWGGDVVGAWTRGTGSGVRGCFGCRRVGVVS